MIRRFLTTEMTAKAKAGAVIFIIPCIVYLCIFNRESLTNEKRFERRVDR